MEKTKNNRKNQKKSHIPFRLNLLFFIVFLLFVTLIVRLGYLQIIKGEEFKAEVERTESTLVRGNVPRGEIYDANLRPLVANDAKNTIMYTRGSNTKIENMAQTAYELATLIDIPHVSPFQSEDDSDISMRDLKDYFYAMNQEPMKERVEEHVDANDIDSTEFSYNDELELISEAELMNFDDRDLKAVAIFTKMNSAYALSTVNVKSEDVSQEEIARVSENLKSLPGITTGTDWDRIYPQGDTLRSILGRVSTEEQGVPETELNEYLAKGYSRNDRVGISDLEKQYETVLRGSKSTERTETDNEGDIINREDIYNGQKGNNLILTTDMEFQEDVDEIVENVLSRRRGLNNSVYAVAINPKNGNVLALSGKKIDENGQVVDDALGAVTSAFNVGSSMKSATVLSGYMDGVISEENNTIIDAPMTFQGSENISSVFNRSGRVALTDITSLKYSSNVYMVEIALRMGGYNNYQPNQQVPIDPQATTDKLRRYLRQFGLGSDTGLDLPVTGIGQAGRVDTAADPMFLSFGNFDTYTPLQLAQYSSTIANGGVRFAPRLVSEVRETDPDTGEVGSLAYEIKPKIMNTIDVSDTAIDRVHRGMHEVVNGDYGIAPGVFRGSSYEMAGKTGAAESFYYALGSPYNGQSVTNNSFVGFAPYDDPEIAIAVVVPFLPNVNTGRDNLEMSRQIFDAYFNEGKYASRSSSSNDTNNDTENENE